MRATRAEPDFDQLVQARRVHRSLYTDPDVFDLEMVHLFGRRWVYLAHESELRRPGQFVTVRMGRRPVIVIRGRAGAIRAFFNRCPHRAATVCLDERGTCDGFVCPYHGWAFDIDGRLESIPHGDDYGPGFDRAQHGLHAVANVESYRGFLFGSTCAEPIALAAHLDGVADWLDAFIDRAPGGRLSVVPGQRRVSFAANWKLAYDNAADPLHPTWVHESYNDLGRQRSGTSTVLSRDPATTPMTVHAWPAGHVAVDQRPGFTPPHWQTQKRATGVEAQAARLRDRYGDVRGAELLEQATGALLNIAIFPNLLIYGNQLVVLEPEAPDRTSYRLANTVADDLPPEVGVMRLRIEEDFSVFGVPDDNEMYERCQRGLSDVPEAEWVDFSRGHDEVGDGELVLEGILSEASARCYWGAYRRAMTDPSS